MVIGKFDHELLSNLGIGVKFLSKMATGNRSRVTKLFISLRS